MTVKQVLWVWAAVIQVVSGPGENGKMSFISVALLPSCWFSAAAGGGICQGAMGTVGFRVRERDYK